MASFIAKISEFGPRIIRILGCNPGPMTLQGTNTYLIGTGNKRVLLDVGEHKNSDYLSSLMSVLSKYNTSIDKIIISHWHPDHIGGLSDVLGCLKDDVTVYKCPRVDAADTPIPAEAKHQELKHQDQIETEGATLKVHYTPGHTTDHVVLELAEEGVIFSGDCILGEGTAVFEDLHSYMSSLQLILDLKPQIIYPGHGPVIENPVDKISYYIAHRNQREEQIMSALNNSEQKFLTPMELVKIIYTETPSHLHTAAANNVLHHLTKLLKDNRVAKQGEKWSAVTSTNKL